MQRPRVKEVTCEVVLGVKAEAGVASLIRDPGLSEWQECAPVVR